MQKWFTLIELIISITILTILATISFINYLGYVEKTNLTKSSFELNLINKSIELYNQKISKYPLLSEFYSIKDWINTISMQWEINQDLTNKLNIKLNKNDKNFYIYSSDSKWKYYQILWWIKLDDSNNKQEVKYKSLVSSYWNKSLIIEDEDLMNISINSQELNIDTSDKNFNLIKTDLTKINSISKNSKNVLIENLNQENFWKCDWVIWLVSKILIDENWNFFDWICENWWELLFSVDPGSKTWKYNSTNWINPSYWNKSEINTFINNNNTEITTKSYSFKKIKELKICRWQNNCYTMYPDKWISLNDYYKNNYTYLDFSVCDDSQSEIKYCSSDKNIKNINTNRIDEYFKNLWFNYNYTKSIKYWVWINISQNNKLWYQADTSWPNFDNKWLWIWVFRSWDCWYVDKNNYPNSYVDENRAYSVGLDNKCAYISTDNLFWYVYWK